MECWGAQGGQGNGSNNTYNCGLGAYVCGIMELEGKQDFYIYVGQQGVAANNTGAWNGGGRKGIQPEDGSGGGSTDIRTILHTDNNGWGGSTSLKSRIIVAAGGGGSDNSPTIDRSLSYGGGIEAYSGKAHSMYTCNIFGASQTRGGYCDYEGTTLVGAFGMGCQTASQNCCGGGGGYYGGGNTDIVGLGGSSYISGHTGCSTISGYVFSSTVMIDGGGREWVSATRGSAKSMPKPTGGTETGHSGNGYCKITWHPAL